MKICVLQPDYSSSSVDYKNYDPPRDMAPLLPGHQVDHVALNKLTTYRQLKHLSTAGYDVFLNLCEGYLEWDIPSIDVIHALDRLRLPYTGPNAELYDPSKLLMKYVAFTVGVATPRHVLADGHGDVATDAAALAYPLFVKPAHAGDSLGIDAASLVREPGALQTKVDEVVREFGSALIEEYIAGREFTVLVAAGIGDTDAPVALAPIEFIFPAGTPFKTYAFKTSELHPESNVPVRDAALDARLRASAVRVFRAFGGVGYARVDFRMDAADALYLLDVNFACSVFYRDGFEGSADYILRYDPMGPAGFAEHIIHEGIARHARATRPYAIRGDAIAGFGIAATRAIRRGDVVHPGEGASHRIITSRHVTETWSEDDRLAFRRYAYPLSDEVFALWDADPARWAPQNHSCDPNTVFDGLDLVAARDVARGEELTVDYAGFLNDASESFECACGASSCRGVISGTPGNSVTQRAAAARVG